ncbi:exodeoxyribonuclease VII large subunit [Halochromatium salexigens]|uniref:Exodeoxyribonuclease 7 large subunit n=1 Tax=Halochromatium salexigens TaxID=49447 RepID=A0AAJ0UGW2_HALSE|nr:exodeoxyribonuclease VII large subunit [Halochromatium salexigens]MBK5931249.1 exodeoxyribonuclease VII large subunit [Halochromatium salexigens]
MPTSPASPIIDFSRDLYSVSRLNAEVRAVLDGSFPLLWVQGELSNLSQPASGHLYFSLKDGASQVRCAMFRGKRRRLGFQPANGQQLLVRARVGLYEPRGDFQLIVEQMEPAGDGALRLALEQLKQRLAADGLFAEAHKRALPAYPCQLGLITSASGAALHDLLTVLGRRFPLLPVLIYPSLVQGAQAVEALIAAIELANRRGECDLLILARGGGSLEDLVAFNDEALARAIHASELPIVTGIGHEIDLSIADLVADRRGATPSAAAELVAPDAEQARRHLCGLDARLATAARRARETARQRLSALQRQHALLHPRARLEQQQQRVDDLQRRLERALEARVGEAGAHLERLGQRLRRVAPGQRLHVEAEHLARLSERLAQAGRRAIERRREQLAALAGGLQARSPLATLARGYAIVTDTEGRLVHRPQQVPPGARIRVQVAEGGFEARVIDDAQRALSERA